MKITEVRYRKSFQLGSSYVTMELAAEPEEINGVREKTAEVVEKMRIFVEKEASKESSLYGEQQKRRIEQLNERIQAHGA